MTPATDFEKLGVFYLGRPYDLATRKPKPGLVLYDSKDLVTHAVCVGMTGSGKTGLCLALLEEAAIDGIPALVIDPKGDLANLLLTFPELRPEDFAPWINEDDARKKGLEPADYARAASRAVEEGPRRVGPGRRAHPAAARTPPTSPSTRPAATPGIPVSILKSFAAPPPAIRDDAELLRERIATTATSLLGLLGIDADPIQSREHILLVDHPRRRVARGARPRPGRTHPADPDAARRAASASSTSSRSSRPRTRFELAMQLNNLLAAPGFAAWMEGEPLDIGRLLYTPEGKPRIAIFSIAHLSDAERMFFVSLLLNQVAGWMRAQSGTTSLRAIVYMDEIFGYFPPVANPPSKPPLLTLLKQARAFGVGVVLATQNPVDLDYKGLSNAGTWFIGRLQTERDKARVLDGLEGAAAGAGSRFDRGRDGADPRRPGQSRLPDEQRPRRRARGLRVALGDVLPARPADAQPDQDADGGPHGHRAARRYACGPGRCHLGARRRAALSAAGDRCCRRTCRSTSSPSALRRRPGAALVYQPMLFGAAEVRFADAKKGLDTTEPVAIMTPITAEAVAVDWERAVDTSVAAGDLEAAPEAGAAFAELPPAAGKPKSYDAWRKDFAAWLFRTQKLDLLTCPRLKAFSRPGETEGDFRARLQHAGREQRDETLERLRKKYAPKMAALEERLRRAGQAVERESEQVTQQGLQAAISVGTTLLGAFLGRKAVTASTIGRATTAARGAGRVLKERRTWAAPRRPWRRSSSNSPIWMRRSRPTRRRSARAATHWQSRSRP